MKLGGNMYSRSYGSDSEKHEIRDNFSGRIPPDYRGQLLRGDLLENSEKEDVPECKNTEDTKGKESGNSIIGSLLPKNLEFDDIVLFGVMLLLLTGNQSNPDVLILLAILFLISV